MPEDQIPIADKMLTATKLQKAVDYAALLQHAAVTRGLSQMRIAGEIVRRRIGRQRLSSKDYFAFGLYRPDLTEADRNAFVSEAEISRLNQALNQSDRQALGGVINSKIMTELVLRAAGLPCSQSVAVARARPAPMPFPVLIGAEAVEAFLRTDAAFPIFGKPDDSSLGIGAASFMGIDGDDLVLGDGSRVPVGQMAREITRDYPGGYVFQTLLRPHPEVAQLIGPIVGTLRVLTLDQADGPEPLFVMLKLPGPGAMVDGALSGKNAAAVVDLATGTIRRAQLLTDPSGQELIHSHVTGAQLPGAVLPDFQQAVALAVNAHRLFSSLGVLGSDIILTDRGPVINEVNLNPLAGLVQKARDRGLFTEDMKVKYRAACTTRGISLPIKGVRL